MDAAAVSVAEEAAEAVEDSEVEVAVEDEVGVDSVIEEAAVDEEHRVVVVDSGTRSETELPQIRRSPLIRELTSKVGGKVVRCVTL